MLLTLVTEGGKRTLILRAMGGGSCIEIGLKDLCRRQWEQGQDLVKALSASPGWKHRLLVLHSEGCVLGGFR